MAIKEKIKEKSIKEQIEDVLNNINAIKRKDPNQVITYLGAENNLRRALRTL